MLSHDGNAATKQADLWKKIESNTEKGKFVFAALALAADLESTFYAEGDVFQWDRMKTTHNVGAHGKVKFVNR
jgi:hypothetical protein